MKSLGAGMLAFTAAALMATPGAAAAPADRPGVTAYPASFFAEAQPETAFDMILRLPGFVFDPGDREVRGLVGAAGNVLVDGRAPPTKQEDLEAVLRRIPAGAVAQIEIVRPGSGLDMQGRAMVANVVRRARAEVRGRFEMGLGAHRAGAAPALAAEGSRRSASRLVEASAALRREVDDDKGRGPRRRVSAAGRPLREAIYAEDKWTDVGEAAVAYEDAVVGGTLRLDGAARTERTRARILEREVSLQPAASFVHEAEDVAEREIGLQYRRPLGQAWKLEATFLHHRSRSESLDVSEEGQTRLAASEALLASEDAARLLLRRRIGALQWEGGAEWAWNGLNSHSALAENDRAVALPFARVQLQEQRRELFVTAVWAPAPELTTELGLRYETSRLAQSGDARLQKSLGYLKPRLFAGWRPTERDELRLEVERRVGQLDFEDFVTSTSLTSGSVTSGNPDLEPEQLWRASLAWQRRLGTKGSLVLTARHDQIRSVVDRIPIIVGTEVFDAPGNIGRGRRDEVQVALSLPLDRALPNGLLKADLLWRASQVDDPATRRRRPISDQADFVGALHLSQDLPARGVKWGADATLGSRKTEFLPDEVKFDRSAGRVDLYVEYRPRPGWNLRFDLRNLTDGEVFRRRDQFAGLRGLAPPSRIETRSLRAGRSFALTLQRSFAAR